MRDRGYGKGGSRERFGIKVLIYIDLFRIDYITLFILIIELLFISILGQVVFTHESIWKFSNSFVSILLVINR